jgi:hypothetical protein
MSLSPNEQFSPLLAAPTFQAVATTSVIALAWHIVPHSTRRSRTRQ